MQQTMLRIKDPKLSIPFYTEVLGMSLLCKLDFPAMSFSLYFVGYEDGNGSDAEINTPERAEWAMSKKATIELTQWVLIGLKVLKLHSKNKVINVRRSLHLLLFECIPFFSNWGTENDPEFKYNTKDTGFGEFTAVLNLCSSYWYDIA